LFVSYIIALGPVDMMNSQVGEIEDQQEALMGVLLLRSMRLCNREGIEGDVFEVEVRQTLLNGGFFY
jgi:hypothetical protein